MAKRKGGRSWQKLFQLAGLGANYPNDLIGAVICIIDEHGCRWFGTIRGVTVYPVGPSEDGDSFRLRVEGFGHLHEDLSFFGDSDEARWIGIPAMQGIQSVTLAKKPS